MGSNSYRGEISWIADDVFISYALGFADPKDPNQPKQTTTSGYFMRSALANNPQDPPFRYSYFTVERSATNPPQTTTVNKIDRVTGDKQEQLATIKWSNSEAKDVFIGLITGYNPPSDLPTGWIQLAAPYYPCYISMASESKPGMGKDSHTGKMQPHVNRITTWDSAILTIFLPQGVSTDGLHVFLYQHKHSDGDSPPQPEEITNTITPSGNSIVIGASGETLQMGLYVVAMPVTASVNSQGSAQTPYAGEQTAATTTIA